MLENDLLGSLCFDKPSSEMQRGFGLNLARRQHSENWIVSLLQMPGKSMALEYRFPVSENEKQ